MTTMMTCGAGRFRGLVRGAICAAASLAFLSAGCGAPPESQNDEQSPSVESSPLKNGTLVDGTSKWNGVVVLYIYIPQFSYWTTCSGVITSRTTVVTAAHCVNGSIAPYSSGYIYVAAERENSSGGYELMNSPSTPQFVKYNPAWTGNDSTHDVAVITMQSPLANVTQADANYLAKSAPSGSTMWALGYGMYDTGPDDWDDQGRAGQVTPTYSVDSSGSIYTFNASSTQPWLCEGDSGGPLKMVYSSHWMVFGIASGNNVSPCGPKGRWATIKDNLAWLEQAIGYDKCTELLTFVTCW